MIRLDFTSGPFASSGMMSHSPTLSDITAFIGLLRTIKKRLLFEVSRSIVSIVIFLLVSLGENSSVPDDATKSIPLSAVSSCVLQSTETCSVGLRES